MVTVDVQVPEQTNPGPRALRRLVYDVGAGAVVQCRQAWPTAQAEVRLEVEDRGSGFSLVEMDLPAAPTGLGLSSLRRRMEQIGGAVEVDSKPGRGTRISFEVPMEASAEKQPE